MQKKIYFFIGTTAELIKVAPVIKELKERRVDFKVISSNQNVLYFEELKPLLGKQTAYYKSVLKPFSLPSNNEYFRFIFWAIKTLGNFILYFKKELKEISKNNVYLIVHGDTVSSLIGAIIARLQGIKLVHIEAGLRSFNFFEPFPEEINRFIISHLADVHFCPNTWSVKNLNKVKGVKIDTKNNTSIESLQESLRYSKKIRYVNKKYFLLILHRQEHVMYKKQEAIKYLNFLLECARDDLVCILVLHKLTEKLLKVGHLKNRVSRNKNVIIVPRLPYIKFTNLMREAEFVATDGGSNQEECHYLGKPCLILRNTSERIEGIGENAVLCKGNENILKDFVENYRKYNRKPVRFVTRPSKIIVDHLIK